MTTFNSPVNAIAEAPLKERDWLELILGREAIDQIEQTEQDVSWQKSSQLVNRRKTHRHQYPHPLVVTPVDEFLNGHFDKSFLVQGSNLSKGGLAFQHLQPIAHQNVALTFFHSLAEVFTAKANLKWCRFTRSGIYQSGGEFITPIEHSILTGQIDWSNFPHG